MLAANLMSLFDEQVEKRPDAIAVVDGSRVLTYGELRDQSLVMAAHLRGLGVGAEDRVGVMMQRSGSFIASTLAILRAGAAYVPVSAADPPARINDLLRQVGADVMVTDSTTAQLVGDLHCDIVDTGPVLSTAHDVSAAGGPTVHPDQACYVMFTSGSTGRPKAVVVTHRNVAGFATDPVWASAAFQRMLMHSPVNFDASTQELWMPLLNGHTIVVAPPGELEPRDLQREIATHDVTALFLTTGLFNLIASDCVEALLGLRNVWVGGDRASSSAMLRVLRAGHDLQMVNGYGPTESTTCVTFHVLCDGHDPAQSVPIGHTMADKNAYVLGPDLDPVDVGVTGELFVGGGGVARGYQNSSRETASRFLPDPFAGPGERMYRTGDLVKRLPDGALDFIGRADAQVKIRGFRVELGEIETAIGNQTGVSDHVVVLREDQPEHRILVAYVVPETGTSLDPGALRSSVARHLPPHMVPVVVVLDALPLTGNGKVDRDALPAPDLNQGESGETGSLEQRIVADVFADLLRTGDVGPDANFFDLGGDSLLAMRAAVRIRDRLRVDLSKTALFEEPTARAVARLCAEAEIVDDPIRKVDRARDLPPSFGQERLWFLEQVNPGDAEYVLPFAIRLRGRLDRPALDAALNAVIGRHEALRTRIVAVDGQPRQVVDLPEEKTILVERDLSELGAEALGHARQLVAAQALVPLDLESAPMLRAELLCLAPDDHVLSITVHHICADAWSLSVLRRELASEYRAITARTPSHGQTPRAQYADFAAWQRTQLTTGQMDAGLEYWTRHLTDAPVLSLPTDRERAASRSSGGRSVDLALAPHLATSLRELASDRNATLFMTLFSAFQILLSRYCNQWDIVTGTVSANRHRAEFEDVIGFFANTIALRTRINPCGTFLDVLEDVRRTCMDSFVYDDIPFERVVERIAPQRNLARQPVFQMMFVMQNTPEHVDGFGAVEVEDLEPPIQTSRFDLTLYVEPCADGFLLRFAHARDLFEEATVRRMAESYLQLLESLAQNPQRTVTGLALLTSEQRSVLTAANDTAHEVVHSTVGALVTRVAREKPDLVAVECGPRRLTYGELERRSRGIAACLRRRGVATEDRVGLFVQRGPDLVIAMLGILRSGATYVPLDVNLPTKRIAAIAADAQLSCVVTDRDFPVPGQNAYGVDDLAREDPQPDVDVKPENVAYLIYTSGSTGVPKGVLGTHRGLLNYLAYASRRYDLGKQDRVLQLPSPAYDASLRDMLVPLVAGARVILREPHIPMSPESLHTIVEKHGVTALLSTVPSMLRDFGVLSGETGRRLRLVVTSGESIRHAGNRPTGTGATVLLNQYGPTECTMTTTVSDCSRAGDNIGFPIINARVHLLDLWLREVPVDVVGEVYISGAGLARGYWRRPAETADHYIPDPFGEPGARMYRTGDCARRLDDGSLVFLGRNDRQVKVRGNRIELAEIEVALAQHPGVAGAAVRIWDEDTNPRVIAYAEKYSNGPAAGEPELRDHLAGALPDYMVPAAVVVLGRLPRTLSGKVDYGALPDARTRLARGTEHVAPRDTVEAGVAKIFCDLLGLESIGIHDNFFEAGGHSLLAARVIGRLKKVSASALTVTHLFESPTVAGLSKVLRDAHTAKMNQMFGADVE